MTIADVELRLRSAKDRTEAELETAVERLQAEKKIAVESNDQTMAKEAWCLQQVCKAHILFRRAFAQMKNGQYYDAWCALEQVELKLGFLAPHFQSRFVDYGLSRLSGDTGRFQSLFPYKIFYSPEILELEKQCSVCKKVISIRKPCGHRTGEIYDGEICFRIVTDMRLLGSALVENPVQRYSVPFKVDPETGKSSDHYNYSTVKYAIERLPSPYSGWDVQWMKRRHPHSLFRHLGRNDKCPCDSGAKYKKCCLPESGVLRPHCEILLEEEPPEHLNTVEYAGHRSR